MVFADAKKMTEEITKNIWKTLNTKIFCDTEIHQIKG